MPYNTRRKSLSLPSMGIQIPTSRAHRSPPSTISSSSSTTSTATHHRHHNNTTNTATAPEQTSPPAKRLKRSHISSSTSPPPPTFQRRPSVKFHDERPSAHRPSQQTPPPSPGASDGLKVDTDGINDDVVVGVIEQLEKTGNRPHMLKELAAILHGVVPVVQTSANPTAVISSRLTTYLRRPWTTLSPCPLSKELVDVHPRKVYFFLTNQPRQPIPTLPPALLSTNRIISPSLSSHPDEEDDESTTASEALRRRQISPSPELDLSSPEMEDATLHPGQRDAPMSFGSHAPSNPRLHHSPTGMGRHRGASPQAEGVEREFEQMVSTLRRRSKSLSVELSRASKEPPISTTSTTTSTSPPNSVASFPRAVSSTSTSASTTTSAHPHIKQEDLPDADHPTSIPSHPADVGANPDAMRLDLDADELAAREIEESDAIAALRNSEAAAALFGDGAISVPAGAVEDVPMLMVAGGYEGEVEMEEIRMGMGQAGAGTEVGGKFGEGARVELSMERELEELFGDF
ncbi:hypothetical protein P152DRAFT_330708 [Eremomyces bilateralis CBS 781.70]|uniref:GDS1 winged helix domain-containing protein n=1 Tax=Eremomyces bilateralis CBS 781.70 TaxID=1392243 RepID=A0A6G1G487_9PEZI|nr:uncharacterized protein P152DRAFT_330708 [Eremomyces bilateralis CBS 781.70]KAF1812915.1 hypothetical protein P152DRAFT_330708 [Eremomyces bilateralis CBS 781.70]